MKRRKTLTQIATLTSDRSWHNWAQRRISRVYTDTEVLESSGEYVSYNADTGGHTVKTLSGKTIEGVESLTNAGQEAGQRVALSGDDRSGYRFKTVPRG